MARTIRLFLESLRSPQFWSIFLVGLGLSAFALSFIDFSQWGIAPRCLFYEATGLHCPGCGTSRSLHSLADGDWQGFIAFQPLLPLFFLAITYHLVFAGGIFKRFLKGRKSLLYHPRIGVVIALLVLSYWVLRNLPFEPFELLAPGGLLKVF